MSNYHIDDQVIYFGEAYKIKDVKMVPLYQIPISSERDIWVREEDLTPAKTVTEDIISRIVDFVQADHESIGEAAAERALIQDLPNWPKFDGWKLLKLIIDIAGNGGLCEDITFEDLCRILKICGWTIKEG